MSEMNNDLKTIGRKLIDYINGLSDEELENLINEEMAIVNSTWVDLDSFEMVSAPLSDVELVSENFAFSNNPEDNYGVRAA